MKVSNRILDIIEDHACICQTLDQIVCALENKGVEMPNFVPVLNDTLVTDHLSKIMQELKKEAEDEA